MKIIHVISSLKRDQGGPVRSLQGLVAALNEIGVEAWILSMKDDAEPWVPGARKHFRLAKATRYREYTDAMSDLIDEVKPDIVQFHNIWNLDLHASVVVCRRKGIPYICSPRGSLEPWPLKQKWLKKRIARIVYQDNDLHHAAALYATADSEAAQFRKLGFKNQVIVAPNGVNLPAEGQDSEFRIQDSGSGEAASNFSAQNSKLKTQNLSANSLAKRALFVSRMHKKKGVLELVEAWSKVKKSGCLEIQNWICELVYTMNSNEERDYEKQVKARVIELGMSYEDAEGVHRPTSNSQHSTLNPKPSIADFVFTGHLDDDAKWEAYYRSNLFVLPSYSENFGIVVAEALWTKLPVITTKGCPWLDVAERKCGWWIDLDEAKLSETIRDAMLLADEERAAMGLRGRELVKEKYSWGMIAKAMKEAYEKILSRV